MTPSGMLSVISGAVVRRLSVAPGWLYHCLTATPGDGKGGDVAECHQTDRCRCHRPQNYAGFQAARAQLLGLFLLAIMQGWI